jgi:hypothetical protein
MPLNLCLCSCYTANKQLRIVSVFPTRATASGQEVYRQQIQRQGCVLYRIGESCIVSYVGAGCTFDIVLS